MNVSYRASRYNPDFEGKEFAQVAEAVAFAQVGTAGLITKLVDDRTVAGWRIKDGCWYQLNLLGDGELLAAEHPDPAANQGVPDVGDLVEYGLDGLGRSPARYRVNSWIREAPVPVLDPDDLLGDLLHETCREFDLKDGTPPKRLQHCLREEATHVGLTGVCGAIAPISRCKVIGRVDWSEAELEEAREHARRLGATHRMIF